MILELAEQHDVEQIIFCSDASVGLKAMIVIHDSTFGPAAGGHESFYYQLHGQRYSNAAHLSWGIAILDHRYIARCAFDQFSDDLPLAGIGDVLAGNALFRLTL